MVIHSIFSLSWEALKKGRKIKGRKFLPLLFDHRDEPLYVIFKEAL